MIPLGTGLTAGLRGDPWIENRRHVKNYPHGKSAHIPRPTLRALRRICIACGEHDEFKLVVDHINRNSLDNAEGNLQVLCRRCHRDKTEDSPYIGFLEYDARRLR